MLLEEFLEQLKLKGQKLFSRILVNDGDALQRHIAALQTPFFAEHGDVLVANPCALFHPPMRRQQIRIEQATAGIGVDFDEFRAGFGQVKIVAHEHATRLGRQPGNFRRLGQRMRLVGRHGDDRFDGRDDAGHALHGGRLNGDGGAGEELRLLRAQLLEGVFHPGYRLAKKSRTTCSSRVRFIGGRLCQTRRP